jgi:HSP20 family protein
MNILTRRNGVDPLDRVFQSFFSEPIFTEMAPRGLEEGTLPLDISEDEKSVIVRASVPGFAKEDVDVEVHEGVLTIKAQHTEEHEEKTEKFYRKERRVGSMSRRVKLPNIVDGGETAAELKDGVLTVRVPKTKAAQPTKVKIG